MSTSEFVPDTETPTRVRTFAIDISKLTTGGAYVHPIHETGPTQLLFIAEPALVPGAAAAGAKPSGSLGPLPMRTNYDKLLYGTGAAYVAGFAGGGAYGAVRGLQLAKHASPAVVWNAVLNSVGRQGPRFSNSLGALTMGWALLDNLFSSLRHTDDYYNHLAAAFLAGAIFKSTAGVRPALIAGGLMTGAVGLFGIQDAITGRPAKGTSIPSPIPV
ncbi:mitochondrial import inner membrane translocase, subunit timm23 [Physocladia obscura]|uniref:Mitochondrial import inner membrane translocase, subunit timm23 n=1 Tax=Physocladia obscura TaxID=109957 RepID=A0AAD5T1N7_9FUNG|nr:mitochondrial import inner membrane translocase, subunit timm23 [Physocladia obscura]